MVIVDVVDGEFVFRGDWDRIMYGPFSTTGCMLDALHRMYRIDRYNSIWFRGVDRGYIEDLCRKYCRCWSWRDEDVLRSYW